MEQQKIFEVFMDMFDLPTRSELDDAYRSLNDLRREVRALKKALKERDGGAAPQKTAPKASKAPAKRKSAAAKKENSTTPKASAKETVSSG